MKALVYSRRNLFFDQKKRRNLFGKIFDTIFYMKINILIVTSTFFLNNLLVVLGNGRYVFVTKLGINCLESELVEIIFERENHNK